jgi:hypothetical protein
LRELAIAPEDDLYAPLLGAVRWQTGDGGTPTASR